jgi:hypothetical protein
MTGEQATDEELLRWLEATRDEVREHQTTHTRDTGLPLIQLAPDAVFAGLIDIVKRHPVFGQEHSRLFGGKLLELKPDDESAGGCVLLNKAQEIGPRAALDWLNKVYGTTKADVRCVAEVFGLNMHKPYQLSNGVRFIASPGFFRGVLPASPTSDIYTAYRRERPHEPNDIYYDRFLNWRQAEAVAILETKDVRAINLSPRRRPEAPTMPTAYPEVIAAAVPQQIETAVCASVLFYGRPAPVIGLVWHEFIDAEMEHAALRSPITLMHDAAPRMDYVTVGHGAADLLSPYIDAASKIPKLDIAASRLIMARNRISYANKAIDAAICLEALFVDGGNGELRYRVSLRAALFLGKDLMERKKIFKSMASFYDLRSKIVHGAATTIGSQTESEVDWALDICDQAIRKIVQCSEPIDWKQWELGGMPSEA